MTKDKLEDYIKNHKDEFDTLEPSKDLWNGIGGKALPVMEVKNELVTPKRVRLNSLKWITRVAAAILIFTGSYYFHDYRSNKELIAENENPSAQNSQLYNTLMEAEYYYTAQIGMEQERLYSLTVGNSPIREEIQNELKELDKEFNALKEDLKDNLDNEEIIAAMIQNYRIKLGILQDMMMQLQQDKKVKNSDDETKRIQI